MVKEIVAKSVISVGTGTSGPARAMKEALEQVGLSSVSELQGAVATGYGRNSLAEVPAQMSELSCRAKGSIFSISKCSLNYRYWWSRFKSIKNWRQWNA